MDSDPGGRGLPGRIPPFGNPRINAICSSPRLIAAYHVLLRLPMPRHPSCALSSLTTKITLFCLSCFVCFVSTHCIPMSPSGEFVLSPAIFLYGFPYTSNIFNRFSMNTAEIFPAIAYLIPDLPTRSKIFFLRA